MTDKFDSHKTLKKLMCVVQQLSILSEKFSLLILLLPPPHPSGYWLSLQIMNDCFKTATIFGSQILIGSCILEQ
jgi:hypothetical protein